MGMESAPGSLVKCQECNGTGKVRVGDKLKPVACPACDGKGKRPRG